MVGEIVAVQAFSSHAIRNFPVEDTVAISFKNIVAPFYAATKTL